MTLASRFSHAALALFDPGPLGIARGLTRDAALRYQAFTFRPYVIRQSLAGEDFVFYVGDLAARYMYDRADGWPELEFVATRLLRHGDRVADCGANHGLTGILFARRVGQEGNVVGFEPCPGNLAIARYNTKLNAITNFEVREEAVGARAGSARFVPEMNGRIATERDRRAMTVPMVTLDDAFADGAPDFLKIDVEGHEIDVLAGAERVLSTLPRFDIEIHVDAFDDPRAALAELVRLIPMAKYEIHLQRTIHGAIVPVSVDDELLDEIATLANVHLFGSPSHIGLP
jgi:FkbM family methyltransferase